VGVSKVRRGAPEAPSCFEMGPSDPPQYEGLGSMQTFGTRSLRVIRSNRTGSRNHAF
jgi:hypothetical protein